MMDELRAQSSAEAFDELALAMATLADADHRKRGFRDVVKSLLPRELVMQSWIFREGKAEGRKEGKAEGRKEGKAEGRKEGLAKGLQPLVHLFERRLGRPLTRNEQTRLAKRLRAEGPEKVGDVVLDLSATELSAWLAPSNGHGT